MLEEITRHLRHALCSIHVGAPEAKGVSCSLGAIRSRTPVGLTEVSTSSAFGGRCGSRIFASLVSGSVNVCSRGRRTVPPRPGQGCARLVCGVSALPILGGSAPGPLSLPPKVPAAPRVPRPVAPHGPTGPADHRARENPPLPGSRRARFTRAAPTDRGPRSTTATEPPRYTRKTAGQSLKTCDQNHQKSTEKAPNKHRKSIKSDVN